MKPMASVSIEDQTAIRDLVEIGRKYRRLVGFAELELDMQERVQARLLDDGFAATWDGPDLVIGRMIK